ncbi:MAG: hypothetical protein H6862_03275 [Rhodospirillales bacterium]|nr:hypothetical protein [Rhodospirillales bacterium]
MICLFSAFSVCPDAKAQESVPLKSVPEAAAPQAPDTPASAPLKGQVKIDPVDMADMQAFYGRCAQNTITATYYDCRCLAVKYLDKRLELGRYYSPEELMFQIQKECTNTTEIAGYSYGVCTKQLALMDRAENSEAYCECFANAFAKAYQANPQLSSRYVQILQRNAYVKCAEHRR